MGPYQTYQVGSASPYAGKSLNQINALGASNSTNDPNYQGIGFNPQDFAKYLGIGADSPLTAGQTLNYSGGNQGDMSMINRLLTPVSQGQLQQQAIQPAVSSLEASKSPLEQKYKDLLGQIKGNQTIAENRQTVSTKNELARRGISGGGYYDQELTNALNPITSDFTGQYTNTANQQNTDMSAINNAIAQLQAGAGKDAIDNAFRQLQLSEQSRQFDATQRQSSQQFGDQLAQALKVAQMQNGGSTGSPKDNFLSLGEGSTLYNLLNGQTFTAPKSYAPKGSSSSGNDPLGLGL